MFPGEYHNPTPDIKRFIIRTQLPTTSQDGTSVSVNIDVSSYNIQFPIKMYGMLIHPTTGMYIQIPTINVSLVGGTTIGFDPSHQEKEFGYLILLLLGVELL
jgi:hypothetical protein